MPLETLVTSADRAWGIWKLSESEDVLASFLRAEDHLPKKISNAEKRLEWMGARVLTQALLERLGYVYKGIIKDEWGKPFPAQLDFHLSLTHSFPFVAAIIDKHGPVGIDLEQPKDKLLRIAPRVLHHHELIDAGTGTIKHCVYWCAKEALVKIHGKKDLTFAENLRIEPFQLATSGSITGKIIVNSVVTEVPLQYEVHPDFVLVFNKFSDT